MEEKEGSIKIEEVKIKRNFKNLKTYQKIILYFMGVVLLFMLGVLISYLTSLNDSKTHEISIDYELNEEEQLETVTITSNVKMTSIEVQEEVTDEEIETTDATNEISKMVRNTTKESEAVSIIQGYIDANETQVEWGSSVRVATDDEEDLLTEFFSWNTTSFKKLANSAYGEVIIQVYDIYDWDPSGTTEYIADT